MFSPTRTLLLAVWLKHEMITFTVKLFKLVFVNCKLSTVLFSWISCDYCVLPVPGLRFLGLICILIKHSVNLWREQPSYHLDTYNCDLFVFGPEFAILRIPLPKTDNNL